MQTPLFYATPAAFPQDSVMQGGLAPYKPLRFMRENPEKYKPLRFMQMLCRKFESLCGGEDGGAWVMQAHAFSAGLT